MSMILWYPLTGDTNDYCENNHATSVSSVINDNGKIGKCYNSNGTGYIDIPVDTVYKCTDMSISIWVKINSWGSSYDSVFAINSIGGPSWSDNLFSLLRDGTTHKLVFAIGDDVSTSTMTSCSSSNLNLSEWYHFTCVYKRNNSISLYVNGNIISEFPTNLQIPFNMVSSFRIGRNSGTSYQTNMCFNDVRIFNHVLSKKEIKEISKAKFIHYPFNELQEPTVNLLSNTTFTSTDDWVFNTTGTGTFSVSDGWGKLTVPTGETGRNYSITQKIVKNYPANQYFTFSLSFRNNIVGKFAIKVLIYADDIMKASWYMYATLDGSGGVIPVAVTENYSGVSTSVDVEIITGSKFSSVVSDSTVEFTCAQLEEKDYATEYTQSFREGSVKDVSGFRNHIQLTDQKTAPRWVPALSRLGSGVYEYIATDTFMTSSNATIQDITISVWIKKTNNVKWMVLNKGNTNTNGAYYIYGETGADAKWRIFGPTGTMYEVNLGTIQSSVWYNLVGTFDSKTGVMCGYKNNVLMGTVTGATLGTNTNNIIIGKSQTSHFMPGYIDDLRIYATALSPDDVSELYGSRMSIDENNTLYSHNLIENINYDEEINNNNLILNGNCNYGNNTNFSQFSYSSTEKAFACTSVAKTVMNDEFIEIEGNGMNLFDRYVLDGWVKQNTGTMSRYYYMIICYDKDKNEIGHDRVTFYTNTATTLAQPLKDGDLYVYPTTTANWYTDGTNNYNHAKTFACWPIGVAEYPNYTYSRHNANITVVDKVNNKLTLQSPWNQGAVPAGSAVINSYSGASYSYIAASNALATPNWTYYSGTTSPNASTSMIRYGTKYVKIGFLINRDAGGSVTTYVKNLRFYNIDNMGQRLQSSKNKLSLCDTGELKYNSFNEVGMNVRYIRDKTNGSNKNTGNHWVEIEAYDFTETNVAINKSGTSALLTNGDINSVNYYGGTTAGVIVDLGKVHFLSYVNIRHYYADNRIYYFVKTEVSEDNINWITIFDSEIDGRYEETSIGKNIPCRASSFSLDVSGNMYINEINEVVI